MSRKSEIKNKIAESESEIEALESKLMRSLISVMGSLLDKEEPSEADREHFRVYRKLIEVERENLKELYKQLDQE